MYSQFLYILIENKCKILNLEAVFYRDFLGILFMVKNDMWLFPVVREKGCGVFLLVSKRLGLFSTTV